MAALAVTKGWGEIPFLDKITKFAGSISDRLLGSTSFTPAQQKPRVDPFGRFGVVPVAEMRRLNTPRQAANASSAFSVATVKDRLSEFLSNKVNTKNFGKVLEYLHSKDLRLETWRQKAGAINMLVDNKTNDAVPAAAVHKSLNVNNTLQRAMLFRMYSALAKPVNSVVNPGVDFQNWNLMKATLSHQKLGYTFVGGQSYIGKLFVDIEHEKKYTIDELRRHADEKGVELIYPTVDGTANSRRVPGLPVLIKHQSVVAEKVHTGLNHGALALAFGVGLIENLDKMSKRAAATIGINNEDAPAFDIRSLLKKKDEFDFSEVADDNDLGFAAVLDDYKPNAATPEPHLFVKESYPEERRELVIRQAPDGNYAIYCKTTEAYLEPDISMLPEGTYPREDVSGKVLGYVRISDNEEAKFLHYGLDKKRSKFEFPEPESSPSLKAA